MASKKVYKINIRNTKKMDITYIAQSQGMRVGDFVRAAVTEYCDKYSIPKLPSNKAA